jgi:altronate dehydratase
VKALAAAPARTLPAWPVEIGEDVLELIIKVASGERQTKAELLSQDDFIPWKRGVSL